MDLATILGLICGSAVVVGCMVVSSAELGLGMYWDLLSLVIVMGGSLFATMMRLNIPCFMAGLKAIPICFKSSVASYAEMVDEIIECATVARKGSILSLEKHTVNHPYLNKAVRSMVDGYDADTIEGILSTEMLNLKRRHKHAHDVLDFLGESCPAFGMIGTVVGLIVIMANLSDPSKIGPGLAVALVTTLYGSLFSTLIFIPLSSKLKFNSTMERTGLEMIKIGSRGIIAGENPKVIRAKLSSYLGEKEEPE
ncbi:MAG: motility protein A [Oligoflexales bacterium]